MPKQESIAANRLLLYAMLLAASYTLTRTVGDSLFLSRVGNDSLAVVFVVSGISTAILAAIWFALTRRLSLSLSIKVSSSVSAALTFAAWLALPHFHHSWWLLASIYLLTELKGCVNTINVVSATNEILGGHSSRHAWAKIGLGAPFAGVIVGLLVGVEADYIDIRTWLLVSAIIDLCALLPLVKMQQLVVPRKNEDDPTGALHALLGKAVRKVQTYACSKKFRFWIGTLIAAKVVALTIVTFLWKVSVNDYYDGNELKLAQYFAGFYACVGLLTLLLQAFVTGWLLSRRKLHIPILVMPLCLFAICAALAFSSGALFFLVAITLAKSLEIWRRSVHDTALGLLYTKIERDERRGAISFNAAVVKPLSEVGGSVVLLGASFAITVALFSAVAIWIVATLRLLRLISELRNAPGSNDDAALQKSGVEQFVPGLFDH